MAFNTALAATGATQQFANLLIFLSIYPFIQLFSRYMYILIQFITPLCFMIQASPVIQILYFTILHVTTNP